MTDHDYRYNLRYLVLLNRGCAQHGPILTAHA
jgi:hypothetical protein